MTKQATCRVRVGQHRGLRAWIVTVVVAAAAAGGCKGRDRDRGRDVATSVGRHGAEAGASRIEPSLSAAQDKAHRIALVLARIDPSLHALRLGYPTERSRRWRWPVWLKAEDVPARLDELRAVVAEGPALPDLDPEVTAYAAQVTEDAAVLDTALRGYNQAEAEPGAPDAPSADALRPLFERLERRSARIYAALEPHRPAETALGSRHAVELACLRTAELLARLPSADLLARLPSTAPFAWPPEHEIARLAAGCMRAAVDYLELPAPDTYRAQLAVGIGMAMFRMLEGRRKQPAILDGAYHSIAQQVSYLGNLRRRDRR